MPNKLNEEFMEAVSNYYLKHRGQVVDDSIEDTHLQRCLVANAVLNSEELFEAALILWTEKKSLDFLDDYKVIVEKTPDNQFTYRMEIPDDSDEQSS